MKFTPEEFKYVIDKAKGLLERLLPLIEDEQIKTLVVDWLLTNRLPTHFWLPRYVRKGASHPDTMARDLISSVGGGSPDTYPKFLHLHHLTNAILFELDKRENGRTSID
jgi:hypothetical protein